MKILDAATFEDLDPEDARLACAALNVLANLGLTPLAPEPAEDLVSEALSHIRSIVVICSGFPEEREPASWLQDRMMRVVEELAQLEHDLRENLHA